MFSSSPPLIAYRGFYYFMTLVIHALDICRQRWNISFQECVRSFVKDSGNKDVLVLHVQDPFHRLILHGVCEVLSSLLLTPSVHLQPILMFFHFRPSTKISPLSFFNDMAHHFFSRDHSFSSSAIYLLSTIKHEITRVSCKTVCGSLDMCLNLIMLFHSSTTSSRPRLLSRKVGRPQRWPG